MKRTWLTLGTLACVAWPSAAWACGSLGEAQFDLVAFAPSEGDAAVPRNQALVFHFACSYPDNPELEAIVCAQGPARLTVHVTAEGSDQPVAGKVVHFGPRDLFVPDEPLLANTGYHVEADIPVVDAEIAGSGTRSVAFDFRTSEELLPPLAERDVASHAFESYAAPVAECDGGVRLVGQPAVESTIPELCPLERGCSLTDETELAARIVMTTGRYTGPYDQEGFLWTFEVTDAQVPPRGFLHVERRHLGADELGTFSWDLPRATEGFDSRVCARLRGMDAVGQEVLADELCFDAVEAGRGVLEAPEDLDGNDDESPPPEQDFDGHPADPQDGANEGHVKHASSCSTTAAADPFGALSMVIVSLALARRRRRQTT